ncbi:MAG: nucleoside recognition domain-containing protein [Acutalibacteraceae bacterium]
MEFVSVLCEPIMRPVFQLPGEAAINMISSFVSSASVGVYFTEQYYTQKAYTTRQACAVVTNFSVISVGYIGVLASIAGIEERYGVLLIASFVLVLLMGAIRSGFRLSR